MVKAIAQFTTYFRDPTSSLTHFIAALISLFGLLFLVWLTWDEPGKLLVMMIYGLTTIALYLASGIYHMPRGEARLINRLVKFDRASIFLQIAGTYTPFIVYYLGGAWRWGMLATMWGIALLGSAYVILYYVRGVSRKSVYTLLYVGMGVGGLVALPELLPVIPPGAALLMLAGGAFYLIGTLIYSLNVPNLHPRFFSAHDMWHLMTMAGSTCFFFAILGYIAL